MELSPASFISWAVTALVLLGITYLATYGALIWMKLRSDRHQEDRDVNAIISAVRNDVTAAIGAIWHFLRPILQIIIVLFIVYWFAKTIGFDKQILTQFSGLDVKTGLAFSVIGAFCLAAFLSDNPAHWLKDIALIVIGFYFGTKLGP